MSISTTLCRRLVATSSVVAAVALTAIPAGATAATAGGSSFTLRVLAPRTAEVGRPALIYVTGKVPPRSIRSLQFVTVASISTTVMTYCPANSWDALHIANATGGAVLLSTRLTTNTAGRFEVPFAVRPREPGQARICAYAYDGDAATLARAVGILTVSRR